jgi:hypothetical protein
MLRLGGLYLRTNLDDTLFHEVNGLWLEGKMISVGTVGTRSSLLTQVVKK